MFGSPSNTPEGRRIEAERGAIYGLEEKDAQLVCRYNSGILITPYTFQFWFLLRYRPIDRLTDRPIDRSTDRLEGSSEKTIK